MIVPDTRFVVVRVPLSSIVVTMRERRHLARVSHYLALLSERPDEDVLIHLAPHGEYPGLYRVLDGHHRLLASVMAGRADVLALIVIEPGQAGYEAAMDPRERERSHALDARCHRAGARHD